tara:strand:+ start:10619 stop:11170 length:552 start_codon:yes stop_codon:yes gene_type:complete
VWEYRVDGHKTEHDGRSRVVYIGPEAQSLLAPYLLRSAGQVCFSMAESLEQRRQAASEKRVTPASCGNRRGKRSNADRKDRKPAVKQPRFEFTTGTYMRAIYRAYDLAFPAPEPLGCRESESNLARMRRLTAKQKSDLKRWQAPPDTGCSSKTMRRVSSKSSAEPTAPLIAPPHSQDCVFPSV